MTIVDCRNATHRTGNVVEELFGDVDRDAERGQLGTERAPEVVKGVCFNASQSFIERRLTLRPAIKRRGGLASDVATACRKEIVAGFR